MYSYHVVHGWPKLPEGEILGAVAGVGVNSQGHVFVFHRSNRPWPSSGKLDLGTIDRPTVTIFDSHNGNLLARWGFNRFAMPHGLTIDQDDNVWLTDAALQQIFKFTSS